MPDETDVLISDMGIYDDGDLGEDSYCEMDLDAWVRQGPRSKTITLPAKREVELDSITPLIMDVVKTVIHHASL